MDFIRKINRNVQESFSIINEGIQITNGILEVKSIHLPQLLVLSPGAALRSSKGSVCCIFEDYLARTGRGVATARDNQTDPRESQHPTARERLISKFKLQNRQNAQPSEGGGHGEGAVGDPRCALEGNCLLRRFSLDLYKEGLDFVSFFLGTLTKTLDDPNRTSRKVVENQSYLVLYELSQLYDVPLFLKSQGEALSKILHDVAGVHSQLVSIVSSALKLLNQVLKYPLSIYYNLRGEDGQSRLERRKFDPFVKRRFPASEMDDYDLVGSFALVHITDEDKKDLDEYLFQLDSILDESENSKLVVQALVETYYSIRGEAGFDAFAEVGQGAEEYEVVFGFQVLLQRLFAYNDLGWHLFEEDGVPCFWNRYYDTCTYHMVHSQVCCDCRKYRFSEDLAVSGDFCDCFLRPDRCDFRVRVVLEDAFRADRRLGNMLFRMLREEKQTYTKSRILKLMVHLSGQLPSFKDLMRKNMGTEAVLGILEECSRDQFYLLNSVKYGEGTSRGMSHLSEQDLGILTSFQPCALECVLLLHRFGAMSRWHFPDPKSVLAGFVRNTLLVYTYRKCTPTQSPRDEASGTLTTVLRVAVEALMFVQFSHTLAQDSEVHLVNLVEKLDPGEDLGAVERRVDAETFNVFVAAFVLLVNLGKLGTSVESEVIEALYKYLSLSVGLLDLGAQKGAVDALFRMKVDHLPELYKYMLRLVHTREPSTPQQDQVVEIKVDSLLDFGTLPLVQLALTLLDPAVEVRVTSSFKRLVFNLGAMAGMFTSESAMGRNLDCYFCQMCADLEALIDDYRGDDMGAYSRFLSNYTAILLSSHLAGRDNSEVCFLSEYGLPFMVSLLSKVALLYQKGSGGSLESVLWNLLEFTVSVPTCLGYATFEHVDFRPLFRVLEALVTTEGFALFKGIVSALVLYLLMVGVIVDLEGVNLGLFAHNLSELYLSRVVLGAQEALRVDNIRPVDALGVHCEAALDSFLGEAKKGGRTDLVELFFWRDNNAHSFPLPPHVFKFILLFKLHLHPHLFSRFSGFLNIVVPGGRSVESGVEMKPEAVADLSSEYSTRLGASELPDSSYSGLDEAVHTDLSPHPSGVEDSLFGSNEANMDDQDRERQLDERWDKVQRTDFGSQGFLRILRTLYREEGRFARDRIEALQSQLNELSNSLALSYVTNQKMRNRIKELEERLGESSH